MGTAPRFPLHYALASCLYGTTSLAEILPEVEKTGAQYIDLWPKVHGNQREQVAEMGEERFRSLLEEHRVKLGMTTRYDLAPQALAEEISFIARLGGRLIVTGSGGPKGLAGNELKQALQKFVEELRPHVAVAEQHNVTIALENHASSLLDSPDSLRWFAEFSPSPRLGIALAPYHLPQDPTLIAGVVRDCGNRLAHFYAWEHGQGCMTKLPKEQELQQLPGRGSLDFVPILAALKQIDYKGWTEIFMHPVPRGIPILDTTAQVTGELNRVRNGYLTDCLNKLA